jgi:hypothetical protein
MTPAIDSLREKLGLPAAPLVLAGLETTALFFRSVLHQDPLEWVDYLRGIDFHKAVSSVTLSKGTKLIRHDSLGTRGLKPFSYFTDSGASPTRLGTTFPSTEYKEYETDKLTPALKSFASSISFGPRDRVSRGGGGVQYIVAFRDLPALVRVGSSKK